MSISITENGWGNSCRLDVQQSKPVQEDGRVGEETCCYLVPGEQPLGTGVVEDVMLEVTR